MILILTMEVVMKEQNNKTIFIKEDLIWHYISFYFDSLIDTVVIKDKEFLKLFKSLQDYVETKLHLNIGGDCVDIFVMVEKKI